MKVLVLSNKVPYPAKDGSTLAMKSIVDALVQNNAEVTLLALNTLKHWQSAERAQELKPTRLKLHCFEANTNITPTGAFKNLLKKEEAYHVSRFFQKHLAQFLSALLKKETIDIIQLEGLAMAVYLPVIQEHTNTPVILRAHNIEYKIWERHLPYEKNPLKKYYLKIQIKRLKNFEHYAFSKVQGAVFITEVDQEKARQWGFKKPACALPCGVNLEDYALVAQKPEFDLVYLASFDWLPNQQGFEWFMHEVWPLLKSQKPELTMALGGRHMPEHFKKFQDQGVTLFPTVRDAQAFIQSGKIVVVPLLAGSGMRIKILESLALQMPMVTTPLAAEGIQIENQKHLLLAQTPQEFSEAILHLVDHPQQREKIARAARSQVIKQYDNLSLGAQLVDFYQQF